MLKIKSDPRFYSNRQQEYYEDELKHFLDHRLSDQFLTRLMQGVVPHIDYLCDGAIHIQEQTQTLWKQVVKHIYLFYEMLRSHYFRENSQHVR